MQELISTRFLDHALPFLALGAMLAAIVVAINILGKRFDRHDEWLMMLDARVNNLDKDRKATWARRLARPYGSELADTEAAQLAPPLVPPPLPPRRPTVGAVDWEEELVKTEEMTRQTGRYPHGIPPLPPKKGPNDDDKP